MGLARGSQEIVLVLVAFCCAKTLTKSNPGMERVSLASRVWSIIQGNQCRNLRQEPWRQELNHRTWEGANDGGNSSIKFLLPRNVKVAIRISHEGPGLWKCVMHLERLAILPTHKEAARAETEGAEDPWFPLKARDQEPQTNKSGKSSEVIR